MKTNTREILFYYDPENTEHKKTLAYAHSVSDHVKEYTFSQAPSTKVSWQLILDGLEEGPKELFDDTHEDYKKLIEDKEYDEEGWLKIISEHASMMKNPIAVRGDRYIVCYTPTDILKLTSPEESVDPRSV